jgi:hypothetical protein
MNTKYVKMDSNMIPEIQCLFCLSDGKKSNIKRTPMNHYQTCGDCGREWINGVMNEYPIRVCNKCEASPYKNKYVILKIYDGKDNAQLCSHCNSKWIKGQYVGVDMNIDHEIKKWCYCITRWFY